VNEAEYRLQDKNNKQTDGQSIELRQIIIDEDEIDQVANYQRQYQAQAYAEEQGDDRDDHPFEIWPYISQ
jgi:hypothetical protein